MTRRFCSAGFWLALVATTSLSGCAEKLPSPVRAELSAPRQVDDKFPAVNRNTHAPVVYVKLDNDVLRPIKQSKGMPLSKDHVGPFEMREETLAGALELILADKKIPMAFQTSKVMTNTVTISGLQGPMDEVVEKVCGLANLYCSYEDGTMFVKETESFTVSLPPLIADDYGPFVNGLQAITGGQTYVDALTRTLIYTTTARNHKRAVEYFDRLRANTAMIVYEIQIWEVQLSDQRQTGIDWESFNGTFGKLGYDFLRDGAPSITGALGIGAQYTSDNLTVDAVLSFLQTQGAVKTVSQPQLTVLSGSKAKLRVGNKRDYVSQITRTVGVNTADNVSVATSKLETGLNLEINSAWDAGTVYGNLKIDLQDLIRLGSLDVGTTSIQLPETSDRSLETKIRVRPGDALLIGGIVEQRTSLDQTGLPGEKKPLFLTSKNRQGKNTELVFMLRPRVVVYTQHLPTEAQLDKEKLKIEPERDAATEILSTLSKAATPEPMMLNAVRKPVPVTSAPLKPVTPPKPAAKKIQGS